MLKNPIVWLVFSYPVSVVAMIYGGAFENLRPGFAEIEGMLPYVAGVFVSAFVASFVEALVGTFDEGGKARS